MKPPQARTWVTDPRFAPYMSEAGGDHHETIISRPIQDRYDDLLELARIIDPDARTWIENISRVPEILKQRP